MDAEKLENEGIENPMGIVEAPHIRDDIPRVTAAYRFMRRH